MAQLTFAINNDYNYLAINNVYMASLGLPWWLSWKRICLQCRKPRFDSWFSRIPWRKQWQPIPVFLHGKSHGQRCLVGYNPWGHKESDMTKQVTFSLFTGLPWWLSGKRTHLLMQETWIWSLRKVPWRRKWQSTSVFLPGMFHGERSLAGYNPWGLKESDIATDQ